MSDTIFCPDDFVFGLDIGTRNVVGTVGYMKNGRFQAAAIVSKEHETRAMLDGQIHDIGKVGDTIRTIKHELESMTGKKLKEVCIAAAGRVLRTVMVHEDVEFEGEVRVNAENIYSLELISVEKAHKELKVKDEKYKFYCVGYQCDGAACGADSKRIGWNTGGRHIYPVGCGCFRWLNLLYDTVAEHIDCGELVKLIVK